MEEIIIDKIMRSKYEFAFTDLRELSNSHYVIKCQLKGKLTKQWRLNFNTLMDSLKKFSKDNGTEYSVTIWNYNNIQQEWEVFEHYYIRDGETEEDREKREDI